MDIVLSLQRFAQKLPRGHKDRLWLGPLKALYGAEKHTETEWWALIERLRTQPVPR